MQAPLLAVAGPSGGGKTTLAKHLALNFAPLRPVLLSLDRYYRDLSRLAPGERGQGNFDDPRAIEWPLLRRHLRQLAEGRAVQVPHYDFTSHTRLPLPLGPTGLTILEGIFALHEKVRDLVDHGVYVDLPREQCLRRRLERDVAQRGRSPEDVLRQFRETVEPMFRLHVLPTRAAANLVVRGDAPLEQTSRLVEQLLTRRKQA